MRTAAVRFALLLTVGAASLGCRSSSDPAPPAGGRIVVKGDEISGTGTVRFFAIEGGFFAIVGDDGKTYDPYGAIPSALARDGLRVRFAARIRHDMAGIHMVGSIIELITIERAS